MTALTEFLDPDLYAKGTITTYRGALIDFFSHVYGVHREGKRATRAEMERYDELADQYLTDVRTGKRDHVMDLKKYTARLVKTVPPKTLHLRLSVVREFFAGHRLKLEHDDRTLILKTMGRENRAPRAVSETTTLRKEMITSIVMQSDVRMRAFILVLLSSGMRIGEALQLLPGDVDLSRSPAPVHIRRETTKTQTARDTFISPEAVDAVREWLKVRDRYIQNARARGFTRADSPFLFAMSRSGAYRRWDEAVTRAGLFKRDRETNYATVRVHSLRKFFRSYMGLSANPEMVEAWIGHSEGLNATYARHFPPEMIEGEYKKGMHHVTVFGEVLDQETRDQLSAVSRENKELKEKLSDVEKRMALMAFIEDVLKQDPEIRKKLLSLSI